MTVNVECPCGAILNIEDASELVAVDLIEQWQQWHYSHYRKVEEPK